MPDATSSLQPLAWRRSCPRLPAHGPSVTGGKEACTVMAHGRPDIPNAGTLPLAGLAFGNGPGILPEGRVEEAVTHEFEEGSQFPGFRAAGQAKGFFSHGEPGPDGRAGQGAGKGCAIEPADSRKIDQLGCGTGKAGKFSGSVQRPVPNSTRTCT